MIVEPARNEDAHVAPHAIPAGRLRTLPRPTVDTASGYPVPASTNVAIAVFGASSTARHVFATPAQAPFQPAKIHPSAACGRERDSGADRKERATDLSASDARRLARDGALSDHGDCEWRTRERLAFERGCDDLRPVHGHARTNRHHPSMRLPTRRQAPAAVSVTVTPIPYDDVHDAPQLIPSMSLVTAPPPSTLTASA